VLLRPAKTSAVIEPGTSDKLTIYKTLIRPTLQDGSETWVLTKIEENRLLVFERKVLRTIYAPKIVDGVYRSKYNFELDREKSNRLRYAGHMIRGAEELARRELYRAVPEGRRNQRRPKSRWADGVNSDRRALRACDRTNFARDKVQWRDIFRQALTKSWL
jgi:hypothetical protein